MGTAVTHLEHYYYWWYSGSTYICMVLTYLVLVKLQGHKIGVVEEPVWLDVDRGLATALCAHVPLGIHEAPEVWSWNKQLIHISCLIHYATLVASSSTRLLFLTLCMLFMHNSL